MIPNEAFKLCCDWCVWESYTPQPKYKGVAWATHGMGYAAIDYGQFLNDDVSK